MTNRLIFAVIILTAYLAASAQSAIDSLALRVTEGTSAGRIFFRQGPAAPGDTSEYFRISATPERTVLIEGDNPVAMATGLNHYLKYVGGIHLTWGNLTSPLPDRLPLPEEMIEMRAAVPHRYYLNYCTFSYSMPFWDEDRWMKEIDWMVLHGVNMPLSITGVESVWRALLRKLGYSDEAIGRFISGPAFFAWWQMNNLEGWGGPLPDAWYGKQEALQRRIMARMRSLGIEPVLPGFAGMVPSDINATLGFDVADPGRWCCFRRPAFLSPESPEFASMADAYYQLMDSIYGPARYYSMDPFHEGGNTRGVNLAAAARAINGAMKRANPEAKWVIQSWGGNPRRELMDALPAGDLLVLDLYSEKVPKWREPNAYGEHPWLYCMLLNFGGNVGLHGRMDALVDGYYDALADTAHGPTLTGVGATPEGIENNPVMYELLFELPWRPQRFSPGEWLEGYLTARYGTAPTPEVKRAWQALANTVYNCPVDYPGQGTVESLMCARPDWNPASASTWGYSQLFYDPDSTALAARLMAEAAPAYAGSNNFDYDLTDITRQANADEANRMIRRINAAHEAGSTDTVRTLARDFLDLILRQDSLLSRRPDMSVGPWLDAAGRYAGTDTAARELYRRNAALLITVWGDSAAANVGGLADYSHREWGGLLRELYHKRWKAFFDYELGADTTATKPDYYRIESEWVDSVSGL